jgi:RHS repeat-associated protein
MPDGNPLIAQERSTTTAVTGIGIAEAAQGLAHGVSNGDWVEAGLSAAGAGLEVLSMVIDPLGTLASYGVSWLIEHVRPLKEALDWFAGDPPVITSFSETWGNVATEVNAVAQEFLNEVGAGTSGWTGAAADSYRGHAAEVSDAVAGAGALADGISAGVMIMGEVVAFVREFVRDMVGELVGRLIAWALEVAATLGFATPVVVAQATTAISKVASRIADLVRKLVKTIGNVSPRIRKIVSKLDEIIGQLAKLMRKADGSATPSAARHADGTTPHVDGTTPSSATTTPDAPGSTTPSGTRSPDTTPGDTSPSGTDTPGGSPDSPDTPGNTGKPGDGTGDGTPMRDNAGPSESRPTDTRCTGGDPIDLATGEMLLAQTDLELPGTLPLVITRAHHSAYRFGRAFGRTWTSTLDERLEVHGDGVWYAAPDGVVLAYPAPPADGSPVFPATGPRWPLVRTEDGGLRVTHTETGLLRHFPAGEGDVPIAAIADRNGNRVDFVRGEDGGTDELRHTGGYRVAVDRDGARITALRLLTGPSGDIPLVRYGYDDAGRLTEVVNSSGRPTTFAYDPAGRVVRWEDRNGEWYAYTYDEHGRCVRTEGSGGALTCTIGYDTERRTTTFTDSRGQVSRYQFTETGQLAREISPLGNVASFEWDSDGKLVTHTDPLGAVTRYRYDAAGNMVAVVRPDGAEATSEYNELGQTTSTTEPDGAVWRYEYDAAGNRTAITDPSGATTRFAYNGLGHLTSTTNALGQTSRLVSNAVGLVVSATDPLGVTARYQRDVFGRLTAVVDALGGTTRFRWTTEGKLLSRTQADGTVERWRYDGEGNSVEHVDAAGGVTRLRTTHFNLPLQRTESDGAVYRYTYDTELHLTAVTNPAGAVWRYTYDAEGHLESETDFNGRTIRYAHDAAGRLRERVNGAGEAVRFTRDVLGNVVRREAGEDAASFEHDVMGRLVRAVNGQSEITYRLDALGRTVEETVNGRTLSLTYDALGRTVNRRTPGGAESTWHYDANSRPIALMAPTGALAFEYDGSGREIARTVSNGPVLTQAWDLNDRVLSQTVSMETGPGRSRVLHNRRFGYRPDGMLASVEDPGGTRRYALDPAGRVTQVNGAWTERYAYDAQGNLTFAAHPGEDDATQGAREYSGTEVTAAGGARYRYDSQGRVVERRRRTLSGRMDSWAYRWDAEDRLVEVTTPDGARWQYEYDALGRRIAKQRRSADGQKVTERVEFAWEGTQLVEERHASNGRVTTWDWRPGANIPVSQREHTVPPDSQEWYDERFYSIVTDLVGAPTELIDPHGAIAWRSRNTVWGLAFGGPGNGADTPLRFPGQYHDRETGLHYNYRRYYDPETGRFQGADPLGYSGGQNPHAYVPNPTVQSDPLGLTGYGCGLTQVGPNTYESPAGLRYNPEAAHSPFADRFEHVLNHTQNQPNRTAHGVFNDPNPNAVAGLVDDAYRRIQNGEGFHMRQGQRDVYVVNMGQDIGYFGGVNGGLAGNPPARYVQLVLQNGNEVITAYPVSAIPSSFLA